MITPTTGKSRHGAVLIYAIVSMVLLLLMGTLAVDWGRAQLVKTELQSAADAAARYGVAGLKQDVATATTQAKYAAGLNTADGKAVVLTTAEDVEFGTWDPATRSFEALSGTAQVSATAVRVTTRRVKGRNNAIPVTFGRYLKLGDSEVTTSAVAARGNVVTPVVKAKGTPWLAGVPAGGTVDGYGGNSRACVAPENSPTAVTDLPLVPGGTLYFRQTTGQTSYEGSGQYGPDGQLDRLVRQQPANGINATTAPIMALVGIFLDDRAPGTYADAPELDYSTDASRDKKQYKPKLKQVFFIGDGLDSGGNLQEFVVPAGTTRFYLGLMDEKAWWWDNVGELKTTMLDDNISLVK
ncbi:MAG: wapA 1 [Phycisphaerales bacterium]|nr:wapA 1 [Phycisphaerales bacterium]